MSRKVTWKKWISVLIAFAFVVGSIAGMGNQKAEAAAGKTIRSVRIMQGGKNVTKKTFKMKAGASKKLTVKVKTSVSQVTSSKTKINFRSSNKKVVTVTKNGKLNAKKSGSARITVTVSKKGFQSKKTWVKVSVEKANKASAAAQSSASAESTKSPNVSGSTPLPVETTGTNITAGPTVIPGITESPSSTVTPDTTESPAATPDATETAVPNPGATTAPIPDIPENPDSSNSEKILVAYFSWSGTSERIAQNIITQTGADSFRIERETPYSDDYNTVAYGEAKDEADNNARPPLKDPLDSVAAYDKIVLCYPIWWHTAPMTVGTFLESYDLTGKTIYPISQSASMSTSQYEESVAFVKECAKGAIVDDGLFTKDNDAIREYVENTILK